MYSQEWSQHRLPHLDQHCYQDPNNPVYRHCHYHHWSGRRHYRHPRQGYPNRHHHRQDHGSSRPLYRQYPVGRSLDRRSHRSHRIHRSHRNPRNHRPDRHHRYPHRCRSGQELRQN